MRYSAETSELIVKAISKVLKDNEDGNDEKAITDLITKTIEDLIKPKPNLNITPPEVIMVS